MYTYEYWNEYLNAVTVLIPKWWSIKYGSVYSVKKLKVDMCMYVDTLTQACNISEWHDNILIVLYKCWWRATLQLYKQRLRNGRNIHEHPSTRILISGRTASLPPSPSLAVPGLRTVWIKQFLIEQIVEWPFVESRKKETVEINNSSRPSKWLTPSPINSYELAIVVSSIIYFYITENHYKRITYSPDTLKSIDSFWTVDIYVLLCNLQTSDFQESTMFSCRRLAKLLMIIMTSNNLWAIVVTYQ